MSNYGWITSRGVVVPDTAELLASVENEWKEAFGQDLVVTPDTPQGVLISAETQALLDTPMIPPDVYRAQINGR